MSALVVVSIITCVVVVWISVSYPRGLAGKIEAPRGPGDPGTHFPSAGVVGHSVAGVACLVF